MTPGAVARMRSDIALVLRDAVHEQVRRRLMTVDQLLADMPLDTVLRQTGASAGAAKQWIQIVRRDGVPGLLHRKQKTPRRHLGPTDAPSLHALAASEKDRHVANRLRAMACLAEGCSTLDAAVRVNSNISTVVGWRRKFLTGGVAALCTKRGGRKSA